MKWFPNILKFSFVLLLITQFSCRKDFDTIASSGNLTFSSDTIFLDTVFNNLTTTTQILTVYNKSKNDITIPKIQLGKPDSKYRLNVDGIPGNEFDDILVLKEDSIFVLIETTVDASETDDEMLYTDQILFDPNGNKQDVDLVTLVKEATLLYPTTGTDFELTQTTFSKDTPYVIYGNAIVPENGSLTIAAGSTIYFSENASLTLSNGSTFNVEGTLQDSVVFRGDRLNYNYDNVPGQWAGIKIQDNVTANINYLQVLNPTVGFEIKNSNIQLKNTEIYNAGDYSISAENATITGENLVLGQARVSNLKLMGGTHSFKHCTFANYWTKGIRFTKNIALSNYTTSEDDVTTELPLLQANFTNCILAGSKKDEVEFDTKEEFSTFNFSFNHCIINLEKGDGFADTDNATYYNNCLFNKNLDFRNTALNDLRIGLNNEGIDKADASTATSIPLDIIGTDRTTTPDIGAYQHIDFKTLEPDEEDE